MSQTVQPGQASRPPGISDDTIDDVRKISLRSRMALWTGAVVARVSRAAGFGGHMIGGRVALMLRPRCLAELSRGRRVVLVSGTNGKTTTTAMLATALAGVGEVASNASGANMLDGLTAAMAVDPAPTFVGEIDELYLPTAVQQTNAAAIVLLNLTRDQLDRASEIRRTASRLIAVARELPDLVIVANCDDPYVVLIAEAFDRVVWVSAGTRERDDGASCPRCGYRLSDGSAHSDGSNGGGDEEAGAWACERCGLRRPQPHWWLTPEALRAPDGTLFPLRLRLPGEFNRVNAAMAVAAGHTMNVPPAKAIASIAQTTGSAGRYQRISRGEHEIELLLAKNPAGWSVLLDMLCAHTGPVIIAINARQADGQDTSWLYDVHFERLVGRRVIASGERASELGVRLSYAGIEHTTSPDPLSALRGLESGRVLFVGDYTSFWRMRQVLEAGRRD